MKIHGNTRQTLFRQLDGGDAYYLNKISHNSIPNMIDIGANIGMISLIARMLHPSMKIFSFEPHPKTFEDLKSNVDGMQIKSFNFAMGNGEHFYLTAQRKMDLCNKFSVKEDIERDISISIQSLKLQEIFKRLRIEPEKTFLKMDCEGSESFLVGDKEAEDILRRTKFITMEAHGSQRIKINDLTYWFMNILSGSHVLIIDRQTITLGQLTAVEKSYYRTEFK